MKLTLRMTYRGVPFEIEVDFQDQADLHIICDKLMSKCVDEIEAFIDRYMSTLEAQTH
jgi:hypothetical protein